MTMTAPNLSKGPVVGTGEKCVHIIFVPEGIGSGEPGPDGLPTEEQLAEAVEYIGTPWATDVIVFAGLPWHFVEGKLRKHPEVHTAFPTTVLTLTVAERDKAVWWSELPFDITSIVEDTDGHQAAAATARASQGAPYPFPDTPVTHMEDDVDHAEARIHVARSTVPVDDAKGHEYKISFTNNGREIDPNMRCN